MFLTSDNFKLGTLKEFIDGCSKGAKENQSQMQWEGVEIDIEQFCKCMANWSYWKFNQR